ncbi:MAG: thioredoxin family protein [Firmicutes bacterium]|nr:thioredoxin family protein [Bacillota bacterium]
MKVEIFGVGCPKCKKTEELIAETIKKIGVDAEIIHVTELDEIIDRGIVMTPAVMIDGVKKMEGKIPTEAQIRQWFGR